MERPKIAIVDNNTLAVLGLKQMLLNVMPILTVETFGSMAELQANHPEQFFSLLSVDQNDGNIAVVAVLQGLAVDSPEIPDREVSGPAAPCIAAEVFGTEQ